MKKRLASLISLLILLGLVVFDSSQHFDSELVELKRQHHSAQRNWNLFFGQRNVFNNSSLRYRNSFKEMALVVEPNSLIVSDLPSSYYSAAHLPVYVRNVHPHHGFNRSWEWRRVLGENILCYIDADGYLEKFEKSYRSSKITNIGSKGRSVYILLNKDTLNGNLRKDCIARRAVQIGQGVAKISEIVYSDGLFDLYLLKD
jgi:hypothetical protein